MDSNSSDPYLAPSSGLWWACDTGLTPCISTGIFNASAHFCVMVQLYPRILCHSSDSFEDHFRPLVTRYKREPISISLASLMGLGVAAGVGMGVGSMVHTSSQIAHLQAAIDQDLKALETSITAL